MKTYKVQRVFVMLVQVTTQLFGATFETVQTGLGPITGEVVSNGMNKVYHFRSIPYAKPPVGELRFQKPRPYGSWNGTLNATRYSPSCIQVKGDEFLFLPNAAITEDCLFLNVYVPTEINVTNSKPVMVWIHGGGFISGQASLYDGSNLALRGDVIVVTINYRLGIFGFISSGDSSLPGNYGLWDQRMATQWVKNNIASFGGDPSSITLFGQSAGSWSANIHAMSPINQGLFQRVILQSGSALSSVIYAKVSNLEPIARRVKCVGENISNVPDIAECLRNKSYQALLDASTALIIRTDIQKWFTRVIGASVDGELILDDPLKLLSDTTSTSYKFFRSLDIIVGTTDGDGSVIGNYASLLGLNINKGINATVLCELFSTGISKELYSDIPSVSQAICDRYKVRNGDSTMKDEQSRKVIDMFGDVYFVGPAVQLLNIHSYKNTLSKTYQYSFERALFRLTFMAQWFHKAEHGSELPFLFQLKRWAFLANIQLNDSDLKLYEDMVSYWTNFARTGNPNSVNNSSLLQWLEYDKHQANYQLLDINIAQKSNLVHDRMKFWLEDLPEIMNPTIHTNSGPVKGMAVQYPLGTILHFKGIPYAKPPIGNLRFMKPEPVDAWNVTLDATHFRSPCLQTNTQFVTGPMSEDCLFLNIYVPGSISSTNKKVVMVWIHGGGYNQGEGAIYDGSILALRGDVIFVSLNYRLDVLGFLTSGDSILKGNYGIWDQRLAIKWIKDNILAFGGNPSAITIFGESAGGFSVALQAISPLNVGLFQRVIVQSGTFFTPFAFQKNPRNLAVRFAILLNCSGTTTSAIAECLRSLPAKTILSVSDIIQFQLAGSSVNFETIFKATVDGELIPDDPSELIKDTSSASYRFFKSLDMIAGTTTNEGSLGLIALKLHEARYNFNVTIGVPSTFICDHWAPAIASTLNINKESESTEICNKYGINISGDNSSLVEHGRQTLKMFSDAFFVASTVELLAWHSRHNYQANSYQFIFSRRSPPKHESVQLPPWFDGASHGSDVRPLFGSLDTSYEKADYTLSENMMKYWTNFAKQGDPNEKGLPRWSDFGYANKKMYLDFGSDAVIRRKEMLWTDRIKFWFELKGVQYIEVTDPISGAISMNEITCIYVIISVLISKFL